MTASAKKSSLTDAQCEEIVEWAKGCLAATGEMAAIVVDRNQTPGEPQVGRHSLYAHPEDYLALHRWADAQSRWWF